MEILTPMLNRDNIIFFTKMAYNKLSVKAASEDDLESVGSHQEEEEVYPQEEEDHFDQYTNQGKLIFLQGARLYQSKAYSPIILCFMIPSQVLFLPAFTLVI
jgi:hypothetical protein